MKTPRRMLRGARATARARLLHTWALSLSQPASAVSCASERSTGRQSACLHSIVRLPRKLFSVPKRSPPLPIVSPHSRHLARPVFAFL